MMGRAVGLQPEAAAQKQHLQADLTQRKGVMWIHG